MLRQAKDLNRANLAVKQHLRYVEQFSTSETIGPRASAAGRTGCRRRQLGQSPDLLCESDDYGVHRTKRHDERSVRSTELPTFTDHRIVEEVFTNLTVCTGIRHIIKSINDNAAVA